MEVLFVLCIFDEMTRNAQKVICMWISMQYSYYSIDLLRKTLILYELREIYNNNIAIAIKMQLKAKQPKGKEDRGKRILMVI